MQQLNIILPFYITNAQILKVLAKVVGAPFTKNPVMQDDDKINPDLPCSNSNIWSINFNKNDVYYEHRMPKNADNVSFVFKDFSETEHEWGALGTNWQTVEGKNLNPISTSVNLAIGKRLVDFFGGYIHIEKICVYDPEKSIYTSLEPALDKIKYNPFDSRKDELNYLWHLFENELDKESLLTLEELMNARQLTLPDGPKEDQFYKSLYELNKTLFYNKLNEKLDKKDSVSNFKKKI